MFTVVLHSYIFPPQAATIVHPQQNIFGAHEKAVGVDVGVWKEFGYMRFIPTGLPGKMPR